MWPLFCNVAKLLKMDDVNVELVYRNWFRALHLHAVGFPYSISKGYKPLFPRSYYVDVPHVHQLFNWDCGLACVLMVLRTLGVDNCDFQYLEELSNTNSIWTIDLAYLLHKFSVSFTFLTVTIGANPDYSIESFYKDQLSSDMDRVERLFDKAKEHEIEIECRPITGEEISFLILSGQYIAIALVDKYKLSHQSFGENPAPDLFSSSPTYAGHFVVICGYDGDANEFEIRDPASSSKCERVPFNRLDEARKSFGTDEDILLVSLTDRVNLKNLSV